MRKKILVIFSMMLLLCAVMLGVTACDISTNPPHTHTFNKQVVKESYLKKSATCTEKAEYYYSCSCGEKGTETFEDGKSLGHEYNNWTFNGDGTHTGFCVNDISHTLTKECNVSPATCTKKSLCNDCGAEYGDVVAHVYNQKNVDPKYLIASATCENKPLYYYSCACGDIGTDTFEYGSIIGHDYQQWESNGDNTHSAVCANDVTHIATENCNGGTATCTTKAVCKDCGIEYGNFGEHHFSQEVVDSKYLNTPATCETKATYYKSCECGEKGTEDTFEYGEILGHSFEVWESNGDDTHKSVCEYDNSHVSFEFCNGGTSSCDKKAICVDCGGEYGTLEEHFFNQKKVEDKFLKSPATHKTKAIYYYSCVCGEKNTEKTFEHGEVLDPVEINFISDGVSEYVIVIPDSLSLTGTTVLAYAVNDLHDYVSLATNGTVDLPIVKASKFNATSYPKYISVGDTGLVTADLSAETSTLGEDGLFYFSEADDIFFIGTTIYGVANGIYDFLRTYLGFDAITDNLVVYDENVTDVSFYTLYKVKVPDIAERFINGVDAKTRARYGARNGYMGYNMGGLYNDNFTAWKVGSMHNALDYIPYSTHKTEHGAYWYATDANNVIITKTGGSTPLDVCYTAHGDTEQYQAMVNEYAKLMKEMFVQRERLRELKENGGYSWTTSEWDTLTIMTEDNGTACNCISCQETKALYGGYNSGAMIKFVNDVKRAMDSWFNTNEGAKYKMNDFKIMFSAYQKFIDAPVVYDEETDKYVAVHPDVVPIKGVTLQIATSDTSCLSPYYSINADENAKGKATIEKWASLVEEINLWTYQANFANYLYFGDTFELFNEEGYTFFNNNKVTAWVNQNSNAKETSWAALKEYVSSKLMWDTSADLEEIYDSYFDAVYGTASTAMRNLFDLQREAFQEALASYVEANPNKSVAGYAHIFNGHYDDAKLQTIIDGYRDVLKEVNENSYEYYQIIKEAVSPYFIALTNHNRYGEMYYGGSVTGSLKMDEAEINRIQTLKLEFKQMLNEYEAVYGKMHRSEGTTDLSSDIVFNQLGYVFRPSNAPISMIIYQIGGIADKYRVGSSTKTLSVGKHVLGWAYGYPDAAGNGSLMYRNVKIEVLSGEGVISVVAGEKVDGSSISYVDGQGYISSTNAYSGRNYYGTLNCEKEGTAVLRLHYDLDGMHYTYDLTITVTAE